ncbi:MAG: hypothetical protein H0X37_20890 [Herpetosiphonaceae bacterium]|nr:hypothetical protein [Herpetosiphonaceae bacterium]
MILDAYAVINAQGERVAKIGDDGHDVLDAAGKRVAVLLEPSAYDQLIEQLEDLEDACAFYEARLSGEEPIPLTQPMAESQLLEHHVDAS